MSLAVIGVAFAAVCVWLIVRIANRREEWAMATAVVVAFLGATAYLAFADRNERPARVTTIRTGCCLRVGDQP